MGNTASRPVESEVFAATAEQPDAAVADEEFQPDEVPQEDAAQPDRVTQEDASQMSDELAVPPDFGDDWSLNEQGSRVIHDYTSFSRGTDEDVENQFRQMQERNNLIAETFAAEFAWVQENGHSILSAWLAASKIFRDAFAVQREQIWDDSDLIKDEWRETVKTHSCLPVDFVADMHWKLDNEDYIGQRFRDLDYAPFLGRYFVEYLRQGFDFEDLFLELDTDLGLIGWWVDAVADFQRTFDRLESERRLLEIVPALRQYYYERERPITLLSPSTQLREEPGSFRSLPTALRNQRGSVTRGESDQEQDFISLSPSSPRSPALVTPLDDINDKIIRAFCKDFRYLKRQRWPPEASWEFVSSLVYVQVGLLDGDIDQAIDNLRGSIPRYSRDTQDVAHAIQTWRTRATTFEIEETLQEIPDHEARARFRDIINLSMIGDLDFYWLLEQWHYRFKERSISRRNSIAWVKSSIEEFRGWLANQVAADVLESWIPRLFHCLAEDDSDDEGSSPYNTRAGSRRRPTFDDITHRPLEGESGNDGSRSHRSSGQSSGNQGESSPLEGKEMILSEEDDLELQDREESSESAQGCDDSNESGDLPSQASSHYVFTSSISDAQDLASSPPPRRSQGAAPSSCSRLQSPLFRSSPSRTARSPSSNRSTSLNPTALSTLPMPSTARPSDIQGPSSPPVTATFNALVQRSIFNAPPSRRRHNRYRDPRVRRVDPLRYENRLEQPRRLPNTPTASHLPPRPHSWAGRSPTPRGCPTCGRKFRNRGRASGRPATIVTKRVTRSGGRVVKPVPETPVAKRAGAGRKVKAKESSSTEFTSTPAPPPSRYPSRKRKAPSKYEG